MPKKSTRGFLPYRFVGVCASGVETKASGIRARFDGAVNELAAPLWLACGLPHGDAAGLLPGRPNSPDTYAYVPSLIILMAPRRRAYGTSWSERPRLTEAPQVAEGIAFAARTGAHPMLGLHGWTFLAGSSSW